MIIPNKATMSAWKKGTAITDEQLDMLALFFTHMELGCLAMGPQYDLATTAFAHHRDRARHIRSIRTNG